MRTLTRATLCIVVSAALFACKPKEEASAPTAAQVDEAAASEEDAPAAVAETIDACTLTMTAPGSNEWTTYWDPAAGGGATRTSSVHWADEDEKSAMRTNNSVNPLAISCSSSESPGIMISLSALNSTETDVPMAPGTYPIVPQLGPRTKPGEFVGITFTFDGRPFESRSGSLTIARFDTEGVQGSFVIDGDEPTAGGEAIHLEGTFDIPCFRAQMQSACTSTKSQGE